MMKERSLHFIILIVTSLWLLILSCPQEGYSVELKVIVSIYPLEDITKNIGGKRISVKTLIPPGVNPHAYEPPPSDIKELGKASLFIKIGAGLEFWAEGFVRSVKKEIPVLDLSEGLKLLNPRDRHSHEGGDPHFWLDPIIVKSIVDRITLMLIRLDPEGRDFYISNASAYKKKLDELHETIKKRISLLKKKRFVALHPAWNYFSLRYGLKPLYIIEGCGREPRPGNIKRIIDTMKREKIKVVFSEPQFNPQIAEAIASEVGGRVLLLDPIGSPHSSGRKTYIDLMLYNLRQLEEALR